MPWKISRMNRWIKQIREYEQWNHSAALRGYTFVLNIVDVISLINKVIENTKL